MGKRDEQRKLKLTILSKIRENKPILFGPNLSKDEKSNKWREINSYAISIGAIAPDKDWKYMRDVWWPKARKLSVDKINKAKATALTGGRGNMLTAVDNEILEIVGKDSPRLNVAEPLGVPTKKNIPTKRSNEDLPVSQNEDYPSCTTSKKCLNKKCFQKKNSEIGSLVKAEMKIQLLRLNIYKKRLECKKLEMELGLPPSIATNSLKPSIFLVDNPNLRRILIESSDSSDEFLFDS